MPPDFTAQMTSVIYKSVFDSVKMLFFSVVVKFWYYWLILILLRFAPVILQIIRFRKAGLPQIDRMSGPEFEEFMERVFRKQGFEVERVAQPGDRGADLVIDRDSIKIVVQVKRYNGAVGVDAVQEANTAKAHYGAVASMVVTNRYFTREAKELAKENQVQLRDRNDLAKWQLKE